ncbi:hypothetical protein SBDP1_850034 [Syntrophobacter sp. SbD1]|nr:hypothetical protein SBDP1_850034 [Syntrophobacter sp. SbD1]
MGRRIREEIVLVAPGFPRRQIGAIQHLPLAILCLAAWLRERGSYDGQVKVLDANVRNVSAPDFTNAAVVGISAMTGYQVKHGLRIAAMVREANPGALIVWGGIHPSLLPEQTAAHPLVDAVVVGEGEQTFLEVIDAVFSGRDIDGIPGTYVPGSDGGLAVVSRREFLDLDSMPLPAYDLVNMGDYAGIENQFDYQSSRGCPFKCGFCYNTVFCGSRWRKKASRKVVEELIYLHEKYKVAAFALVDDEFFIDLKRTEAIFDGILASGNKFSLVASCRLDTVRRFPAALIDKMKQAGVIQMFFGAESGSPKILRAIQKGISTEDMIEGAKVVAEAGIRPILSFMSGFPGETSEDFDRTIDIIPQLWATHSLITINGIFPFNPYPGTALYLRSLELGLKAPESLDQWGEWNFQYEPDNPWLSSDMKYKMEIAFYMVRFMYYLARLEDRYKGKPIVRIIKILSWPAVCAAKIRMSRHKFGMALEWRVFALLARKTFGYL